MTPVLLCLHGWGGSQESFAELRAALTDAPLTILTPDLPGFGGAPEPKEPWGIEDYAQWVETWLQDSGFRLQDPLLLLGHSFGGQIAVQLAARGSLSITHLYLCAAAAIRPRFSLKRSIGFVVAKAGRGLLRVPGLGGLHSVFRALLYKLMRVHDYERASPVMQKTMLNITHDDLTPLLSSIAIPTDLFWGTDDKMTPLKNGRQMVAHLPAGTLHVFPGVRHAVHRSRAAAIAAVIRETLSTSP